MKTLVVRLAAATASVPALAGSVYTTPAAFLGQTRPGHALSSFNAMPGPEHLPSVTDSIAGFAYEISGVSGGSSTGTHVTWMDGGHADYKFVSARYADAYLSVDLSGSTIPVTAVGATMYVQNGTAQSGTITASIYDSANNLLDSVSFASDSREGFRGFTSDVAIARLEIRSNSDSYVVTMDNFYIGAVIAPLPPAGWAGLAMLGVMGCVRVARRRG